MVLCYSTKGNIIFFFVLLSLFSRDFFLSLKLTSKRCFSENSFGYPLFFRRVLKLCMFLLNVECGECVLRRRNASPFTGMFESFLYAWWMTRIKIWILKDLCLFVMHLHIKGGVSIEARIVFFGSFMFSMKFIKSFESLR